MHERLGLILFKFAGVVGVAFEIAFPEQIPRDAIKPREVIVKRGSLQIGVPDGENERNLLRGECVQRRNQNHNFNQWPFGNANVTRLYVQPHRRIGREVKRDVIAEHSSGLYGHFVIGAPLNQFRVADLDLIRVAFRRAPAMPPVIQNPRHIGNMRDAEAGRLFWIERNHGKLFLVVLSSTSWVSSSVRPSRALKRWSISRSGVVGLMMNFMLPLQSK